MLHFVIYAQLIASSYLSLLILPGLLIASIVKQHSSVRKITLGKLNMFYDAC